MFYKFIIISMFLISCSGYHLKDRSNPFFIYGIKTMSVPMFVNQTPVPGISSVMTKEFLDFLRIYSKLKVKTGEDELQDAILVGIIGSDPKVKHVLKNTDHIFTSGDLQTSIGDRNPFYLPSKTELTIVLRLVLIKHPSTRELLLIRKNNMDLSFHPKVIFDREIILKHVFSRSNNKNLTPDDGGVVNFTNDKNSLQKTIGTLAKDAVRVFNHEMINVF